MIAQGDVLLQSYCEYFNGVNIQRNLSECDNWL